jgi:uncharacterized protein involved in tolerance to divalent cations
MYFAIEKAQKRSDRNNLQKAMKEIGYDPEKIMTHVIEKMLRCANMMQFHLFSRWKNSTFTDKEKRALMKKNRCLTRMADTLQRRHDKNLKAGFNGVA